MGKIDKGFWYFCTMLTMILSGCILWQCGFSMDYAQNLENIIQTSRLPIFLFGLAAALLLLLCLTTRTLQKLTDWQLRFWAAGAFCLMVFGQMAMIFIFRTTLRGDHLKVFESATQLMRDGTLSNSSYVSYYSTYPNNIPLALFSYLWVNVFRLLQIPKNLWMDCAKVVGVLFLDGGLLFGYLILRKLQGQKTAALLLLIAVLNPGMYLLSGIYYSSTISLFFAMGALWLFVEKRGEGSISWFQSVLIGLFLGMSFKIRATGFISGIAILLCAGLSYRKRSDLKRMFKNLAAGVIGFLMIIAAFQMLDSTYVQIEDTSNEIPMIHWVMMGASGDGTYNPEDVAYTQSFADKEAKTEAAAKRLTERVKTMGLSGMIELFGRKLAITFSDGTDDFYDAYNGTQGDAGYLTGLSGSRRDFFVGYLHIYNTMVWLGIFLGLLIRLFKRDGAGFVIMLSALGGILFQMIWECGEAYSIPYLILFFMLAAEGIDHTAKLLKPLLERKSIRAGCLAGIFLLVTGACFWVCRAFSGVILVNEEYRVRQTVSDLTTYPAGAVIEQTFTADEPFNEIELYTYNGRAGFNEAVYEVLLLDEDGKPLADQTIVGEALPVSGSAYVQFDTVYPESESVYTIRITSLVKDKESGIVFSDHRTGIFDLYQGGTLYVNGKERKNCDMAFTVYLRTEESGI